jgi:hypothetical protein
VRLLTVARLPRSVTPAARDATEMPAVTRIADERRIVYVLRAASRNNTLDKFVFVSKEHAETWMSQPGTIEEGYRIERWLARLTRCTCGAKRDVKLLKRVPE